MPNLTTLSQLRTRVRQYADMVSGQNANFCSDSEINGYINDSYSELYDLLVLRFADYFHATTTFSTVALQESYALPDDFYKLKVAWMAVGNKRRRLRQLMVRELANYQEFCVPLPGEAPVFRLEGSSMILAPIPSGSQTIEVWYVPQYQKMQADTDGIAITVVNGWEEYIVVDAAIKCRDRADLDTTRLVARKQGLEARVTTAAADRNEGEPQRVSDVRGEYRR